jgi:hypothetical protein
VGNRFLHTSADVAHVALDHGGEARFGVLAVGCDEVLAASGLVPSQSWPGTSGTFSPEKPPHVFSLAGT